MWQNFAASTHAKVDSDLSYLELAARTNWTHPSRKLLNKLIKTSAPYQSQQQVCWILRLFFIETEDGNWFGQVHVCDNSFDLLLERYVLESRLPGLQSIQQATRYVGKQILFRALALKLTVGWHSNRQGHWRRYCDSTWGQECQYRGELCDQVDRWNHSVCHRSRLQ